MICSANSIRDNGFVLILITACVEHYTLNDAEFVSLREQHGSYQLLCRIAHSSA